MCRNETKKLGEKQNSIALIRAGQKGTELTFDYVYKVITKESVLFVSFW